MAAKKKPVSKKAVPAKAKKPAAKKAKLAVETMTPAAPKVLTLANFYRDQLDTIDKKLGLVTGESTHVDRLSTNLLTVDYIFGGGLLPAMTVIEGEEAGGKSSLALNVLASSVRAQVPINIVGDAEGTITPMFADNILHGFDLSGVFERDARYYDNTVIEGFTRHVREITRMLPDKLWIEGTKSWAYAIPKGKKGKETDILARLAELGMKPDKKLSAEDPRWIVPTSYAGPEGLVIIDSLASLLPEDMDEDDDPKNAMAAVARVFSMELRMFAGRLKRKGLTVFCTNQLREKPGRVYGDPCFAGDTTVLLEGGEVDTIRNIVLRRRKVKVLAFDKLTGRVSYKRVTNWFNNGWKPTKDLFDLSFSGVNHKGEKIVNTVTVTADHKVWTPSGLRKVRQLKAGSVVYNNSAVDVGNDDRRQVLYGSLIGDGTFTTQPNGCGFYVTYRHVKYQRPYLEWKAQMVEGDGVDIYAQTVSGHAYPRLRLRGNHTSYITNSIFDRSMAKMAKALTSNHSKGDDVGHHTRRVLRKLDLRGLAVWFMDDGHYSADSGNQRIEIACTRFDKRTTSCAVSVLKKLTGLTFKANSGKLCLRNLTSISRFTALLAPYVHPSMAYKLHSPSTPGEYKWESTVNLRHRLVPTLVTEVAKCSRRGTTTNVFDLEVEDYHTYFVGGRMRVGMSANKGETKDGRLYRSDFLAVSNCYAPGGKAIGFYSSARARMMGRAVPEAFQRDKESGNLSIEPSVQGEGFDRYSFKGIANTKNKGGRPFLKGMVRVNVADREGVGRGFCPVFDALQFLHLTGQAKGTKEIVLTPRPSATKALAPLMNRKIKFQAFKALVTAEYLGDRELTGKALKLVGIDKPVAVRKALFTQMRKDPTLWSSGSKVDAGD